MWMFVSFNLQSFSSVAMWGWLPFTGCISAVIFINRRTIWVENSSDYFLTFCILTERVELNLVIINWHDCKMSSMPDKIIRLAISFLKFKQLVCYVTETKNIGKHEQIVSPIDDKYLQLTVVFYRKYLFRVLLEPLRDHTLYI